MSLRSGDIIVTERLSRWKTIAFELLLLVIAISPLLPNFSNGLRYTAFFYRWPYFGVLLGACSIFFLCFIAILPLLWRAIFGLPAVLISDTDLVVYGLRSYRVKTNDIARILPPRFGNVPIKTITGKQISLPLFLYQHPDLIRDRLDRLQLT
jgi:hypothetical protein